MSASGIRELWYRCLRRYGLSSDAEIHTQTRILFCGRLTHPSFFCCLFCAATILFFELDIHALAREIELASFNSRRQAHNYTVLIFHRCARA